MTDAESRGDRPASLTAPLLRPCLLVLLLGGPAYGYELRGRLASMGVSSELGPVYRALNNMEDEGLLRSEWETTIGGRSRRHYELSENGAALVAAYVEPVEQLVRVTAAFLRLWRRRPTRGRRPSRTPDSVRLGPAIDRAKGTDNSDAARGNGRVFALRDRHRPRAELALSRGKRHLAAVIDGLPASSAR